MSGETSKPAIPMHEMSQRDATREIMNTVQGILSENRFRLAANKDKYALPQMEFGGLESLIEQLGSVKKLSENTVQDEYGSITWVEGEDSGGNLWLTRFVTRTESEIEFTADRISGDFQPDDPNDKWGSLVGRDSIGFFHIIGSSDENGLLTLSIDATDDTTGKRGRFTYHR